MSYHYGNDASDSCDDVNKTVYGYKDPYSNLNYKEALLLLCNKQFIEYALTHGKKNMIQLFKHFNFPIPKIEEKINSVFLFHILYKKNSQGKLIPRENVYYYEKTLKGYINPFKPPFTKLFDELEKEFDKIKKEKIMTENIEKLRLTISRDFTSNNKKLNENDGTVKILKYFICIKYYANQFGFKDTKQITIDEISSIGQIYYLIKTYPKNDANNNPFEEDDNINNYYNDPNCFFYSFYCDMKRHESKPKKTFLEKLIQNSKIRDNAFNYLSTKSNEPKFIYKFNDCSDFSKLNFENDSINRINSQELPKNKLEFELRSKNSNNIMKTQKFSTALKLSNFDNKLKYREIENVDLSDEYRIILILKGKRIQYSVNDQHFYFKFYYEQRCLNTVEVVLDEKLAKKNYNKFKEIMSQVKNNEEIIIVFAYNPINYFNIKYDNIQLPPNGIESVCYLDSSKENPNVFGMFESANK